MALDDCRGPKDAPPCLRYSVRTVLDQTTSSIEREITLRTSYRCMSRREIVFGQLCIVSVYSIRWCGPSTVDKESEGEIGGAPEVLCTFWLRIHTANWYAFERERRSTVLYIRHTGWVSFKGLIPIVVARLGRLERVPSASCARHKTRNQVNVECCTRRMMNAKCADEADVRGELGARVKGGIWS